MLNEYIGNIIKTNRKRQKLTQLELASRLNTDRQYLSKIEKGKINLTISYLEKIMQELNIQPQDIFNETITN